MGEKPDHVEESNEEVDGIDEVVEDSLSDDSSAEDEDEEVASEEDGSLSEAPLTEEEIEELIAELLEVESKAAEAQEALEKESLEKVEKEVREELAQKLQGDDLEKAVADEMAEFREEWEESLDELETQSAELLEQLDGAGIDIASIYKWIESRAPNGCCTEAWKKRTHWVGSEITNDAVESIREAEKHLQALRPVRSKNGKILEEGASGFLGKKVAGNDGGKGSTEDTEVDWSSFNKLFSRNPSKEGIAFGSEQWASVYLASTPQQAAAMGLKFPGVDEVEEIDEIDDDPSDPFVADAIANERELDLSEEQRMNYRKVREQDDVSVDQKLQLRLKRRRRKQKNRKKGMGNSFDVDQVVESDIQNSAENCGPAEGLASEDVKAESHGACEFPVDSMKEESNYNNASSELLIPRSTEPSQGSKRLHEDGEMDNDAKRSRIDISDSDNEAQTVADRPNSFECDDAVLLNHCSTQENGHEYMHSEFHCTACSKITDDVHQHPLLKVIVCGECKCAVEAKMSVKDPGSSQCYCAWCGRNENLINCRSCSKLFCLSCVKRNIGVECSSEAKVLGWKCCCCSPELLQELTMELERALSYNESTSSSSDSDSDGSDDDIGVSISSKKMRSKKIRRILDDTELGEETKKKIAMEKERQERLKSLKAHSGIAMKMNSSTCNGSLPEGASSEVLGDASNGYIVNVVREKGEVAVRIPPSISSRLKTHQVKGIRFMWENIIQSIRNVKAGDKGLGCILAHTMGLGKTFQVIAFLYTAMRSVDLGLRTALIVAPVNVLHNWRQEFKKWKPTELDALRVYMMDDKQKYKSEGQRAQLLTKWRTRGGVFLINYTTFRNLALSTHVKDLQAAREICSALLDGPDILVCDEAHVIKNTKAGITQALKQVRCQRRIALTGSPLQNNLMEYYCMVDFVREGFLGSKHEFRNRFQNPIENGQHANSTAEDVRIMNQRSHILSEQLKGFVQRMDMSVAAKDLPPKTVFVVAVKLSSLQRKLYRKFLDVHGLNRYKTSCEGITKQCFFSGYQVLAQICNHPWILQYLREKSAKCGDTVEKILPDASSSDENMDSNMIEDKAKMNSEYTSRKNANSFVIEGWWNDLLKRDNHHVEYSGKMVLLMDILTACAEIGDKALVFSQSIPTLDVIEQYLKELPRAGKKGKHWKRGKDWYRIDGKTDGSERQRLADAFNDPQNKRVKCLLVSTRAGALGINLFAANRVIIVDGSWNPTNDLQAIYRAWRYGQKKPVYAYRLVAHGTMEEKIYKRGVQKEGLAARVVDRQQVHRTMSKEEILHLFEFGDDESLADKMGHANDSNTSRKVGNMLKKASSDCPSSCSSDKLMDILLGRHRQRWIMNYHEHETLLQENEEEKLTKEEQDLAWEVFRRSMDWQEVHKVPADESTFEQEHQVKKPSVAPQKGIIPEPVINGRNRFPSWKCTNVAHLLTLRSQGIKKGCSTVCGACALEISWEKLNQASKLKE